MNEANGEAGSQKRIRSCMTNTPGKGVQAMWVLMIGNKMYTAFKAWRKMRREQLQQEYNMLVEMTLARK